MVDRTYVKTSYFNHANPVIWPTMRVQRYKSNDCFTRADQASGRMFMSKPWELWSHKDLRLFRFFIASFELICSVLFTNHSHSNYHEQHKDQRHPACNHHQNGFGCWKVSFGFIVQRLIITWNEHTIVNAHYGESLIRHPLPGPNVFVFEREQDSTV